VFQLPIFTKFLRKQILSAATPPVNWFFYQSGRNLIHFFARQSENLDTEKPQFQADKHEKV
jgi:hypothetical protein